MPTLNSIKEYGPHTYYHVYNRGLNKDNIFNDKQDYSIFLKLLKRYLDPAYKPVQGETLRTSQAEHIDLVAYCLMPNHYHLLIYQKDNHKALEQLCRSMMTAYSMYYNQKYSRIGPLFQGRYRASRIDSDTYLYHISRYIHLNPLDAGKPYQTYQYSSYGTYKNNQDSFLKKNHILNLFGEGEDKYTDFVEEYADIFKKRSKVDRYDLSFSGLS